jgi:hypothetical protein
LAKRRRNLGQESRMGPANKRPKREETKSNETRAASTTTGDTQGNKHTKSKEKERRIRRMKEGTTLSLFFLAKYWDLSYLVDHQSQRRGSV